MFLTLAITAAALALGWFIPVRWGVFGFLGAACVLFVLQVGIHTSMGFGGTSLEDSLLLFNGSYAAFVGFNVQITYRAFAFPLLALGVALIIRLRK